MVHLRLASSWPMIASIVWAVIPCLISDVDEDDDEKCHAKRTACILIQYLGLDESRLDKHVYWVLVLVPVPIP
ncbi:hypothetical protein F4818DRAFT_430434 [Hypoxylon cercidicola]|nr:hypothetical protein F4818DRAFT_430434 [Hypoxylon cercidicola]